MGVIELRPQMLVSPQEPIEKGQPFSVPFRLDNTGYLSFYVADVFCYTQELSVGGLHIHANSSHNSDFDNVVLDRAEGGTVTCSYTYRGPISPDTVADMAIIIDYKPFRAFPFGTFRKYFRFTGRYVDNWQWTRKPSAEIEAEANEQIEEHLRRNKAFERLKPGAPR